MIYTHEYCHNRIFETYEEAVDDYLSSISVDDYLNDDLFNEHALLCQYFKRKSDESFMTWLHNYIEDLTQCLCEKYVFEWDDCERDGEDWQDYSYD